MSFTFYQWRVINVRSSGMKNNKREELIQKAKKRMETIYHSMKKDREIDIDKLIENLTTYEVELEIQNEELKEANENVKKLSERFSDLYHHAPVGYLLLDERGIIKRINNTALGYLKKTNPLKKVGYGIREGQKPFIVYVDNQYHQQFFNHLHHAISSKQKVSCELKLLSPNGEEKYFYLESVAYHDVDFEEKLIKTIMIDTTQQKIQEKQIKAQNKQLTELKEALENTNKELNDRNIKLSEERKQFLSILDSIPEMIYVSDFDTNEILFANKKLKDSVGRDITGEICYETLQNKNAVCEFCTNEKIKNNDTPYFWNNFNPVLERYLYVMNRKIKWNDQKEVRFELAVDISEQIEYKISLENRLSYEENIAKFSNTLFLDQPDVINESLKYILKAANCSRVYIFENFLDEHNALSMRQTHEVCSKNVKPEIDNPELQHIVYHQDGFERWQEILSQNEIINGVVAHFPKSERDVLESQGIQSILALPIFVHQKWFGFIGFDEITEEKEWTKEDIDLLQAAAEVMGLYLENKENREIILKANQELKEANATKDRFISILAHDLRNPFNGLLGSCELLQQAIDDLSKEEILNLVGYIDVSSKKIFNLLTNLLEWSRIQRDVIPFNPKTTNLYALISETYDLVKPTAEGKGVSLEVDIPKQIEATIDAEMIKTVVRNLLSNGIKFTNKGKKVRITAQQNAQTVVIEISDNGIGMKKETQESLFKIGETKSLNGTNGEEGTGFGLLLCKEFVDKHNGTIEVESEEDKGTQIKVILPLKRK